MKLHYSQTQFSDFLIMKKVSVPYEITLLSNEDDGSFKKGQFQYLMKLHYSQTELTTYDISLKFQYLMKLHYSQTGGTTTPPHIGFSTL